MSVQNGIELAYRGNLGELTVKHNTLVKQLGIL